jgi:hypothetical protein
MLAFQKSETILQKVQLCLSLITLITGTQGMELQLESVVVAEPIKLSQR